MNDLILKFDPVVIQSLSDKAAVLKTNLETMREDLASQTAQLSNAWVAPSRYAFVKSRIAPLYEELDNIIYTVGIMRTDLSEISAAYRRAEEQAKNETENVITDINV